MLLGGLGPRGFCFEPPASDLKFLLPALWPLAFGFLSLALAFALWASAFEFSVFDFSACGLRLRCGPGGRRVLVLKIQSIEIVISGCWCSAFLSTRFSLNILCSFIRVFFYLIYKLLARSPG